MKSINIEFSDLNAIKRKIYGFLDSWAVFQICDSNESVEAQKLGEHELIAGAANEMKRFSGFSSLESIEKSNKWCFFNIAYPEFEQDSEICSFYPKVVFQIHKSSQVLNIEFYSDIPHEFEQFLLDFEQFQFPINENNIVEPLKFVASTTQSEYIEKVQKIRHDILYGKYYEMNFCIEFSADLPDFQTLNYALKLNEINQAPFAVYAKYDNKVILCSSPERFLIKRDNKLSSQPIKGTNKRLLNQDNEFQMQALKLNEKERAENVMIVDLVRNDLSKVCETGSVKVDELFGVYAFKSVNHLISTVSGQLKEGQNMKDVFEALFPMGSMTGAPKIEVMKHIHAYEHAPRGKYSGSLGYMSPNGDYDFNVVIRSLVYDSKTGNLSYKVGSAITYDSIPENEYEECLLKGQKLEELFNG